MYALIYGIEFTVTFMCSAVSPCNEWLVAGDVLWFLFLAEVFRAVVEYRILEYIYFLYGVEFVSNEKLPVPCYVLNAQIYRYRPHQYTTGRLDPGARGTTADVVFARLKSLTILAALKPWLPPPCALA